MAEGSKGCKCKHAGEIGRYDDVHGRSHGDRDGRGMRMGKAAAPLMGAHIVEED